MNPLINTLKSLLSTSMDTTGIVQTSTGAEVVLSTSKGVVMVHNSGYILQEGDEVIVRQGVVVGKQSPRSSLPIYRV